jgi:signal transduction histidine kinase
VSHEIRNPLGIINSSADYLARNLKEDPKLARLSGAIADESSRPSGIVTDFLDFARHRKPGTGAEVAEDIPEESSSCSRRTCPGRGRSSGPGSGKTPPS